MKLEEAYRKYADGVLAFVRKRIRDQAEAEDVFQDAVLKICRNWSDDLEFPRAYFYTAARNAVTDYIRKYQFRSSQQRLLNGMRVHHHDDVLEEIIREESRERLRSAIEAAGLSAFERRVLAIEYWSSIRSAADRTSYSGRTRAAVKMATYRARRKIERVLRAC